jgi:hypothetical protein
MYKGARNFGRRLAEYGSSAGGMTGAVLGTMAAGPVGGALGGLAGYLGGGRLRDRFSQLSPASAITGILRQEYKTAKHFEKPRDWRPNPPGPYEKLNYPQPKRARGLPNPS